MLLDGICRNPVLLCFLSRCVEFDQYKHWIVIIVYFYDGPRAVKERMEKNRKLIQSRDEVTALVHGFYNKVRKDPLIGPIFEDVAQVNWDEHLPKLVNFWSDLLLGEDSYRGRPFPPHIPLNLQPSHFERWLSLFIQTIDENFYGQKADEAKNRALGIARNFMINLSHIQGTKF